MEKEENMIRESSGLLLSEKTREAKIRWLSDEKEPYSVTTSKVGSESEVRAESATTANKAPTNRKPPIMRIPTRIEMKTLTRLAKRPAINIEFSDLSYGVRHHFSSGLTGELYSYLRSFDHLTSAERIGRFRIH